jgi:RNase P subunit RPR2
MGHTGGKDPISLKKLRRGDARWHHEKEILGFLVNGETKTVRISDAKATDIVSELRRILKKKHVQLKRYRRIVGKLCHVALIMPSTRRSRVSQP